MSIKKLLKKSSSNTECLRPSQFKYLKLDQLLQECIRQTNVRQLLSVGQDLKNLVKISSNKIIINSSDACIYRYTFAMSNKKIQNQFLHNSIYWLIVTISAAAGKTTHLQHTPHTPITKSINPNGKNI